MSRAPFSDPGGEVVGAPIGTEDWAKRWRLEFQSVVKSLGNEPERADRYYKVGLRHEVWKLLNKRDGSRFATFEEFCAYEYPWGLGTPFEQIKPYLEALHGKRGLQLVTVPEARQGERVDLGTSGHGVPKSDAKAREEKRLRAVLRAPEPARELYTAGLLGQKEAAKLGPKNPTPEDAARVTAVAQALAFQARALGKPKNEAERVATQKAMNRRARQLLGTSATDAVAPILRAIARLSEPDRARLLSSLADQYGGPR